MEKTSKLISYWLRHKPEEAGLSVDDFGWTSTDRLLTALRSRGIEIDFSELLALNSSFDKVRWEIDQAGGRIRATHGHSFPVLLDDKAELPPETLYHGTAIKNLTKIAEYGLLPMNRQFVHLSTTIDTAIAVGSRHGKAILIQVDTERLVSDGWVFFQTSDNVWLTSAIPVKYLSFCPWFPVSRDNGHALEELRREIGNRTSHFLHAQLDCLKLIWQSSASDDRLFQNQQTGECFLAHLTSTKKEQEVDGWPYIERYKTLEDWMDRGLRIDQQDFYDLK